VSDAERPASPLAITLFGTFDVRQAGCPVPPLRSQKGQWLLALLTLQPGRALERTWLAGLLWPDSTARQAAYNLSRNLTDLRHALGPEARRLQTPSTQTLRLDLVGAEADVLRFDEAVRRGDPPSLEEAVALHRGLLLPGCAEEWVLPEREAREQAYLGALEQLAAHVAQRGEHGVAVRYLRRLVAVDPLRDSGQRALMEALAAGGDLAAATQVYRDFRLLLHRELNAEPDPETTALFQQIRVEARGKASRASGTPIKPPETFPNNLPVQLTSFIGRVGEIREVKRLLGSTHLLTLTGAGGCGETRLGLQLAADLAEEYRDGVWLVELASLSDPGLVPQTVAAAVGVRKEPGRPLTETLGDALRPRSLLLVLDNCEHLLSACAQLAETLLRRCARLRILATSREGLHITGETTYRVPPLSLPDLERLPPAETLTRFEAAQLFVERAMAALPSFTLTDQNTAAVVSVCHRLDGIPLAIELAAARVKALPVEKIAVRLNDRFHLLTSGSRTALPRQQTLRALIDWSYDLLTELERALMRRLSVFAGSWTLEAAEAVCGQDGIEECEVLDLLTSLVEKSLVGYEEQTREARYKLLETIRQYARDRLLESGEGEALRGRHLDFFLRLAEARGGQSLWEIPIGELERWDREHDNLRAALEWGLAVDGGAEAAARLSAALAGFWDRRCFYSEAFEWSRGCIERQDGLPPGLREAMFFDAAFFAERMGDYSTARVLAQQSVSLCREFGLTRKLPYSLKLLAVVARGQGDYVVGRAVCEESVTLLREQGDEGGLAWTLLTASGILEAQSDCAQARCLIEEALASFRKKGIVGGIAWSLVHLARLSQREGDLAQARSLLEEALGLFESQRHEADIGLTRRALGWLSYLQGDYPAARRLLSQSIVLLRKTEMREGLIRAVEGYAAVIAAQGEAARAAKIVAAMQAAREATGLLLPASERPEQDRAIALAREALAEECFAAAWAHGREMAPEQAIAFALER
jgi:predicted ATPase/DNA-binding SARP family transcriptional activator